MKDKTNQWDLNYDNLHDYLALSTQDVNNIISITSPDAPKTLLDIGCGTGQLGRDFFHRGYKTIGIDSSAKAIEIAKAATIFNDVIEYIHTDFENFAIKIDSQSTYGLITCKYVFAFINDRKLFLDTVVKLLDPSGIFVIITPDREKIPAEKSGISVPHTDMLALLKSHFAVESYIRGRDYYYLCRHISRTP